MSTARIRSVITTRSGQTIYGGFEEIDLESQHYQRLVELLRNLSGLAYLRIMNEEGNAVYVHPDDISYVTLEESRAG
jgi:hypothetical protein